MSLEVKNLTFCYKSHLPVFKNVNFKINNGEILSLLGPNGSGKSTLLKCLNRILIPSHGEIHIDEINLKKIRIERLGIYIGYVPQETGSSFPLSVVDAVSLGRTPHIKFKMSNMDKDIVFSAISRMKLEELAFRNLNELSGGERQRVFMARALAQDPRVLLLDEPTSNLDLRYQLETLEMVKEITVEKSISVIMAIHDLNLAARYSDRIVMMKKGFFFAEGKCMNTITEQNIKKVYQVDSLIKHETGFPNIIPLTINEESIDS